MHVDQLIRMVNQMGSFFEAMPDRGEALHDLAQHLQRFWEPRMRRELLAHLDADGSWARSQKARSMPPRASSP